MRPIVLCAAVLLGVAGGCGPAVPTNPDPGPEPKTEVRTGPDGKKETVTSVPDP